MSLLVALFAWLPSFHPTAGGAYAAYGGVYVAAAVAWGWLVEGLARDRCDLTALRWLATVRHALPKFASAQLLTVAQALDARYVGGAGHDLFGRELLF